MSGTRIYEELLDRFVEQNRLILGEDLAGVYLHGSAVMGCFNPEKSDLDLLIVVNRAAADETKRRYMDMVVSLNAEAPAKGLELSVLRRSVCRPFVYPTPFELHFSNGHLAWYRRDPDDYVRRMNGTDPDLAAHVMILNRRGRVLWGAPIGEVFGEVPAPDYFDSIRRDIEGAAEDILENPTYVILNLARVLAFRKEGAVLSKREGGEWALGRLPAQYRGLVAAALADYAGDAVPGWDAAAAAEYAAYMLAEIRRP